MLKKSFVGIAWLVFLMVVSLTTAFAQDPYLVGCSMAVTGPGAETYGPVKDGLDIYFKEVNARGGINGHPVKINHRGQCSPAIKSGGRCKEISYPG